MFFAESDIFWSNLQIFVFCHYLQTAFNSDRQGRSEIYFVIRTTSPHVGKLFAFGRVDYEFVSFGSVADHHPLVNFSRRTYIESASCLEIVESKSQSFACRHRGHRTSRLFLYFTGVRIEADHSACKNPLAFCVYDKLVSVTQKPTSRTFKN